MTEFAQYGYSDANINKIAERAGVSVGSLYKYFNDKLNLYQTIVNHSSDTLKEVLGRIVGENEDVFVIIERIIGAIQEYGRSHGNMFKLYNEMTAENNSELTWKTARKRGRRYCGPLRLSDREGPGAGRRKKGFRAQVLRVFPGQPVRAAAVLLFLRVLQGAAQDVYRRKRNPRRCSHARTAHQIHQRSFLLMACLQLYSGDFLHAPSVY